MPTYMKDLPSKEWLDERYYVEGGEVFWKQRVGSRGRLSVRAGRKVTIYAGDGGYMRVVLKGNNYSLGRIIYQMAHGDLTPEFEIDHKDRDTTNNNIDNLRKVPQGINKRNKSKQINQSEYGTGICRNKKHWPAPNQNKVTEYFVARWYDIEGVLRGKHFNITRLGENVALTSATEYRQKMIEELNQQGAGYTDSHGT